jgi:hypothetical protein
MRLQLGLKVVKQHGSNTSFSVCANRFGQKGGRSVINQVGGHQIHRATDRADQQFVCTRREMETLGKTFTKSWRTSNARIMPRWRSWVDALVFRQRAQRRPANGSPAARFCVSTLCEAKRSSTRIGRRTSQRIAGVGM